MSLPSWQDPNYGSMIRAALWLETEVGEGNIFTKTRLRSDFSGVSQIDRRIRDLRTHGWQIDTRREDPSLNLDEQRYVKKGIEVWIPGQIKAKPKTSLTSTQRAKAMQQDNYLCRSCGIGAGEAFADGGQAAQLDVARREVLRADGTTEQQLVTECNRCRTGGRDRQEDVPALEAEVRGLAPIEKKALAAWIAADQREPGILERLWGRYRTLPKESREKLARAAMDNEA